MKKIILAVVLLISFVACAHAQFYAGGSLGFTSSKLKMGEGDGHSGSSYKLLPEIGYQYTDQLAFGVSLGFAKGYAALGAFDIADIKGLGNTLIGSATDLASSEMAELDLKSFRIAPYVRYTLLKNKTFELFVDGLLGYSSIKAEAPEGSSAADYAKKIGDMTSLELLVRPGIAFKLNSNIWLTAKMGAFGYQSLKAEGDTKITRFGLDIDGNNLLLGALYRF